MGFSAGIDDGAFGQASYVRFADGGFDAIFTSDPMPPEAGPYAWITYPAVNDARDALQLAGADPIRWLLRQSGVTEVFLRVSDPVEGLPGVMYDWNPTGYDLNGAGQALVATPLETPTGPGHGIFLLDEAGTTVVARDGDPAPGGGTFTFPSELADLSEAGDVAFYADVTGSRGIFALLAGELVAVAREGDPAPLPGRTLTFPSLALPSVADSGAVVFGAELEPYDVEPNVGIFRYENGTLTTLVLKGDPVPEAPGHVFSYVGQPQAGGDRSVVFEGDHYEGETWIRGLYRLEDGQLTRIVRTGDVLPRVGGARFESPDWQGIRTNEAGDIAFIGSLEDGRRGVFFHAAAGAAPVPSLGARGVMALGAALGLVAAASLRGRARPAARPDRSGILPPGR